MFALLQKKPGWKLFLRHLGTSHIGVSSNWWGLAWFITVEFFPWGTSSAFSLLGLLSAWAARPDGSHCQAPSAERRDSICRGFPAPPHRLLDLSSRSQAHDFLEENQCEPVQQIAFRIFVTSTLQLADWIHRILFFTASQQRLGQQSIWKVREKFCPYVRSLCPLLALAVALMVLRRDSGFLLAMAGQFFTEVLGQSLARRLPSTTRRNIPGAGSSPQQEWRGRKSGRERRQSFLMFLQSQACPHRPPVAPSHVLKSALLLQSRGEHIYFGGKSPSVISCILN